WSGEAEPGSGVPGSRADVGQYGVGIANHGEVAQGHDADGGAAIDDRQAPERLLTHHRDGVFECCVGPDGRGVWATDLSERDVLGIEPIGERADDEVA